MISLSALVVCSAMGGADVAALSSIVAMPVPAVLMQARPPRPPPRPSTRGRSGLSGLRDKIRERGGGSRGRFRDRRRWGQTDRDQSKKQDDTAKEKKISEDVRVAKEDLVVMREALGKVDKKLIEKERRAKATLRRFKKPGSVDAAIEKYKLDYYKNVRGVVSSFEKSVSKGGAVPASFVNLLHPKRDPKVKKPARGSFDDQRGRFLAAMAREFTVSARLAKSDAVKALYSKLRNDAEVLRYTPTEADARTPHGLKPGGLKPSEPQRHAPESHAPKSQAPKSHAQKRDGQKI